MAVQFFGQYLVEKGVITSGQLIEALAIQEKDSASLGEVMHGSESSKEPESDETEFVNPASIQLKYLDPDDLKHLLEVRGRKKTYLGDVLVRLGHLKSDEVMVHLAAFAKEDKLQREKIYEVIDCSSQKDVILGTLEILNKILYRILGFQFKVEAINETFDQKSDRFVIMQEAYGDRHFHFGLALENGLFQAFASQLLKGEKPSYIVAAGAIEELIRVATGNIAMKLSMSEGILLEMENPRVIFKNDMLYSRGQYVGIDVIVNCLHQDESGVADGGLVDSFRIDFVFDDDQGVKLSDPDNLADLI